MLDEGIYLASIRTMYRVLTLADQVRERRAQAAHPPRVRPELVADGPDQVWTWDITKLKGPWRGTYFDLYVMLDIFSRKAIRWECTLRRERRPRESVHAARDHSERRRQTALHPRR